MKSIMKEMVGGCCVCSDERGWPENPLVYCDGQGCTVAVHQACYGIVTVPTGPWYCRKCESQERSARVRCELCPSKDGALKRTDNSGWAHVVCALYIPEVRFGNVTTMEPIILQLIPTERFNKVCYICEELGKGGRSTVGACMQCNKSGCKQQFHVTCAQGLGLLCEEAGNYLDNVKYCGYCQHHYSKLKGGNVKTIPPYKPIPNDNHSSDSSPEKEAEAAAAVAAKAAQQQSSSTSSSSSSKRNKSSSSSNSKSSSSLSKSSTSTSKSSSTHQKTVHNSSSSSSNKNISASEKSSKNLVKKSDNNEVTVNESDSVRSHHHHHHHHTSSGAQKYYNSDATPSVNENSVVFDRSDSSISNSSSAKDNLSKVSSKKRKAGSRTPTPNSIIGQETDKSSGVSTIVSAGTVATTSTAQTTSVASAASDRRDNLGSTESLEKPKKVKIEHSAPPPPPPPPPISAPSHINTSNTRTTSSPSVITSEPSIIPNDRSILHSIPLSAIAAPPPPPPPPPPPLPLPTTTTSAAAHPQPNSLVVSVPLANTSLSPKSVSHHASNTPIASLPLYSHLPERVDSRNHHSIPVNNGLANDHSLGIPVSLDSTMVSSETSDGLKITYEKQPPSHSSNLHRLATSDNAQSATTTPAPVVEETPAKRSRSQSTEKSEKMGRPKKRGSNGVPVVSGPPTGVGKRASRSQHPTPPPPMPTPIQPGAFSSITQQIVKESPPSSPSDENSGGGTGRRSKGRKATATVTSASSSSSTASAKSDTKELKDVKVFQNGVHAPHMLGNQLNPNSNMAQKMTDHLNSEMEAHSIFNPAENLVGPQLHSRVIASIRSNNNPSSASASNSNSGFSSMLNAANSGNVPQTLDQLLERQWEQGSQFLMEQAQHFDIASLLSCLHQLRAENLRLEEHVNSLLQRRDHLLAVNARLAIPLTNQQPVAAPSQPHTLNNLHPSVSASHGDVPRSRHSTGAYPGHVTGGGAPLENGLPADGAAYPHQHRSPASAQPQPSPTIRHSPAGYPSTSSHGVVRSGSTSEGSGRSQRPPSQSHSNYPQYQGQVPVVTAQPQPPMVIRRDTDVHHQLPSSKPS